jgi:hypothetical protein
MDKEVLCNPIEKAYEHIIIKIGSADVLIKEIEGSIVISNLDQYDAGENMSALENSQPPWCPSGLLKTQKRKLQRAHCKKLKQEGLANMGEQIFNKTYPISPQSSKVG